MVLKMKDIAKLAHVSTSAVSLALNGKSGISQDTREKIFKVINENKYQPLRKRKKGGVRNIASYHLIVVTDKNGIVNKSYRNLPFFAPLVSTIRENINGSGASLSINTLKIESLKDDLNKLLAKTLITNAIILGTDLSKKDIELINQKIESTVFVDTYYRKVNADFVTINNFEGSYEAGKYIINKGYKNIGYAAATKANPNFLMRRAGFQFALKEEDIVIAPDHFYNIEPSNLIPTDPLRGFSTTDLPDVIFCENDYIALRLMKECLKNDLSIPEDVGIMGFDDIEEDTLVTPQLTSVHVSIEQIVNQVIYQLQAQIAAGKSWEPEKSLISTHIIPRNSL